MVFDPSIMHVCTKGSAQEAWGLIINKVVEITSKPLTVLNAPEEVAKRDREIGALDHFISSSAWDLWQDFGKIVQRTSDRLTRWWNEPYDSKAALILDGLSLRELPWLLQGAKQRGFTIHEVSANASELPGGTNEFAQALGFNNRSQLQNNGGGLKHRLQPAHTEFVDMPWKDCEAFLDSSKNWILWHSWPDSKVHDDSGAGQGLEMLTSDVAGQLGGDDFWDFVERLATGRRLVITSDHGYAATGYFHDAEGDVGQFLKKTFSSGRRASDIGDTGPFVPPVALRVISQHGAHIMALGRWKWRSQGGYPTLTHGGLSLLEVMSPFFEITK